MTKRPISTKPPKPRSAYARNRKPSNGSGMRRAENMIAPAELRITSAGEVRKQRARERAWERERDRMHPGIIREGICVECYGFVDDPRHMGHSLRVWPY